MHRHDEIEQIRIKQNENSRTKTHIFTTEHCLR